jgi:UDP-N-acetylmuramyl pentapeptide phosphotransferase/UDP-N-acetylglucosamine-1-phosphate transferase
VQALPLIIAFIVTLVIAPPGLRALAAGPLARENYRGLRVACPLGLIVLAAAVVALIALALIQQLAGGTVLRPELGWVLIYALGVAALGLADDAILGGARGLRGHASAVLRGEFSTGALKAVGAIGLALYVMTTRRTLAGPLVSGVVPLPLRAPSTGHVLLGAAVLVLATNAFNLFDLRPGRAVKVFVLLGAGLTLGSLNVHPLWALGLFAGPLVVIGAYDIRELGMLGDTGSSTVGAVAGAWLILTLSTAGQLVALSVLAAVTAYGELRSISELVDRTPILRQLDSIGRPRDAIDS